MYATLAADVTITEIVILLHTVFLLHSLFTLLQTILQTHFKLFLWCRIQNQSSMFYPLATE